MTPRRAMPADLAQVQAVVAAAFAPYVAVIGRRPAPMDADYATLISAGHVWLMEHAVMACWPEDGAMLLDVLAVAPEAQGRGLGARLVAHCEAEAHAAGLPAVTLYTNAVMEGALRLYPRLGYTETGRRVDQGFSRVFFRKAL